MIKSVQGWEDYKAREALVTQAQGGDLDAALQLARQYNDLNPVRDWVKKGDFDAMFEFARQYGTKGMELLKEFDTGDNVDRALCASYGADHNWVVRKEIKRRGLLTQSELAATVEQKEVHIGMSECAMLVRLGPLTDGNTRCGRLEKRTGSIKRYVYRSCESDSEMHVDVQAGKVVSLPSTGIGPAER